MAYRFVGLDVVQRCNSVMVLGVVFGEKLFLIEESNYKTLAKEFLLWEILGGCHLSVVTLGPDDQTVEGR